MQVISKVRGQLWWVQPRALQMNYELRADEELVATVRFRSLSGSFATAKSADGCWTFKRVGFPTRASDDSRLRFRGGGFHQNGKEEGPSLPEPFFALVARK